MRLLVSVLAGLADYGFTTRARVRCIRHGHRLMCIADGHCCRRCGRFFGYFD